MTTELIKATEVIKMLKVSRSTFHATVRHGHKFPAAVVVGKTPTGRPVLRWDRAEVEAFIRQSRERKVKK